ncbi:Ig-like domain-containing protein [Streptomyces sp. ICBB 8177]|uniref:L,D-transpeptidase n=1 Tax=Streptomyces sp. ICBB 8177 TaxID=563922 RepID=UPI001F5485C0|nr:Ig-like domain-containing protein [Streptomyces sp. ICBB 8177]
MISAAKHRLRAAGATAAAVALAALSALVLAGDTGHPPAPRPPVAARPEHRAMFTGFTGSYTPDAGATVGTGMIVSIVFDHPVADRAAVQRAVSVRATPYVPVAGHWFGDRRLDLRPQAFWAPGTRVDLRLRLRGVRGAPHTYGTQDEDVVFRVGRAQTDTVDTDAHTLTVRRGDQVVRTLAVSAGGPQHATYDGLMVISEKFPVTRMNGSTVGFGGEYDIPDVPHAMRLTDSGTFLHGNYWSPPGVFGTANTSHGCVGLRDVKGGGAHTPAGWLYANSLIGDVVEVTGGHGGPVAPDNGLGGWNMPWWRWTGEPAPRHRTSASAQAHASAASAQAHASAAPTRPAATAFATQR